MGVLPGPGAPARRAATGLTSIQSSVLGNTPAPGGFGEADLPCFAVWGCDHPFPCKCLPGLLPDTVPEKAQAYRLPCGQVCLTNGTARPLTGSSKGYHGPSQAPGATLGGRPSASVPRPAGCEQSGCLSPRGSPLAGTGSHAGVGCISDRKAGVGGRGPRVANRPRGSQACPWAEASCGSCSCRVGYTSGCLPEPLSCLRMTGCERPGPALPGAQGCRCRAAAAT